MARDPLILSKYKTGEIIQKHENLKKQQKPSIQLLMADSFEATHSKGAQHVTNVNSKAWWSIFWARFAFFFEIGAFGQVYIYSCKEKWTGNRCRGK